MHKLLCVGKEIDHKDNNGLNNQRDNLRVCTRSQNQANRWAQSNNTSGFKGVTWSKRSNKWLAQIKYNRKAYNLGAFDDKIQAAKAYDRASIKYHGEFARLNFPLPPT